MSTESSSLGPGDDARLWAIRVGDKSFRDWDGLTAWLEADVANLAAYEAALAQEDWVDGVLVRSLADPAADPVAEPAAERALFPRRWHAWGIGIAAAAAGLASWSVLDRAAMTEVITAPGEHRAIALADGSRVVLNGGTRIAYAPDKPREIALTHGEALFDVRHDESNPFVVTAGGTRLVDAGTVFNVVRERGRLDVAVAEGEVIYARGRAEIRLHPGDALSRSGEDAAPVVRHARAGAIGSWRAGRLEYDNAPLSDVARDLGRNLGRPVVPAEGVRAMRFTGTLAVDGRPLDVLSRAGPLLGVTFVPDGDAWRMTPADAALP